MINAQGSRETIWKQAGFRTGVYAVTAVMGILLVVDTAGPRSAAYLPGLKRPRAVAVRMRAPAGARPAAAPQAAALHTPAPPTPPAGHPATTFPPRAAGTVARSAGVARACTAAGLAFQRDPPPPGAGQAARGRDVVYAFALDYDQDTIFHKEVFKLRKVEGGLKKWAASLHAVGARGVLVHSTDNPGGSKTLVAVVAAGNGSVELYAVYPQRDARYMHMVNRRTGDPAGSNNPYQSPLAIRFAVLRDLLADGVHRADYAISSDASDVTFNANPFTAMREVDAAAARRHLFVGDEVVNKGWQWDWIQQNIVNCYGPRVFPKDQTMPFLNAGLVGGKAAPLLCFVDDIVRVLEASITNNCDMAAIRYLQLCVKERY